MFLLFIAGTEIAKLPGLSSAGANVDILPYTAASDADLLFHDRPITVKGVPLDPQGHPSPAIITRAALLEAGFPVQVVNVGTFVEQLTPHTTIADEPGHDMRYEMAVPKWKGLSQKSAELAQNLDPSVKQVVLAESVPGGTTTAMLVLRALGYHGTVSSAGPKNPLALKEQIWRETSKRLGIKEGDMKGCGLKVPAELGDPMQVAIASYAAALPEDVKITLAGGTQMMAIAAIIRNMGITRDLLVATTKYVHIDPTSCFEDYAAKIGVRWYAAPLDFTNSRFKGLSEYEIGYIKEGVGAGGAVWYAEQLGVPVERIQKRAEAIYETWLEADSNAKR